MNICIVLYPDFETLDVFGPVEILGKLSDSKITYYAQNGGLISSRDGAQILSRSFSELKIEACDILLIPGGQGSRQEIHNQSLIKALRQFAFQAKYVLTVCTGSALLAKTGLLDGRQATSNKRAFAFAESSGRQVKWVSRARWVVDGKFYTSSGVSAGMDMVLGFIADVFGQSLAEQIAFSIEYYWQQDKLHDDFCRHENEHHPFP